jgi:hypothetical protein
MIYGETLPLASNRPGDGQEKTDRKYFPIFAVYPDALRVAPGQSASITGVFASFVHCVINPASTQLP